MDSDLLPQAGPSRRPLQDPSPRRSTSLTHRQRGKLPIAVTGTTDMTLLNPTKPGGITISPFAQSYHHDLLLPPRTPTHPNFQDDESSPSSLRRSASDEGSQRSRSYTDPIWPTHLDSAQSALLQNARVKMSEQDQEAMRKLRSTMAAQAMSRGSSAASPIKQDFPDREAVPLREEDKERRNDLDRTPRPSIPLEPEPSNTGLPFSIAVVGHQGVGKTTVIRRAAKVWGVSDSMTALLPSGQRITSSHSQILPSGKLKEARMVEFIELDVNTLDLSPDTESIWVPGIPSISGVILCYDATRRDTLAGVKEAIHKLSQKGAPMIVLACKSDPEVPLEVDAAYGNSLGEPYNVGLIEVTALSAEGKSKMRNGLRWLLFKLEQRSRRQQRRPSPLNLPAIPPGLNGTAPPKPIPPDIQSPDSEGHSSGGERIMWGQARHLAMTSSEVEESEPEHRSSSGSLQWIMDAPISVEGGRPRAVEVCDVPRVQRETDLAGSGEENLDGSAHTPMRQEEMGRENGVDGVIPGTLESPEAQIWITMDELYRKLFLLIVTNEDERFLATFFLCYRRFSTPLDLMREFRARFRDIETADISKDVRMLALQRLTGALIDWICQYPGDVIGEKVQSVFREILASTLRYTFLAHLAAELVVIEADLIDVEDIDLSWSIENKEQISVQSSSSRVDLPTASKTDLPTTPEMSDRPESPSTRRGASTSALSLASSNISNGDRTTSHSAPRTSGSDVRGITAGYPAGYARANGNGDDFGFGKWSQGWNTFIRSDPRTLAVELTKLQWQKFSAIRPRDVFRHDFGKEKDGPVGEAIDFFNHISRWVSTMILANPKPKHRARTYERFLLITHHLWRLNNYDTLYAIISGMRETSILRLGQTHALVSPLAPGYKEFMGYVKLMDPRNGYAVYRKLLESDMEHASPAIPLITIILGLINRLQSVRREDIREDGAVQWDKFEKFGEILSVISECQNRGPMVPGDVSPSLRALIENTSIIDGEDGMFERSRMLEPPNGAVQGGGRVLKKLANFGLT